MYHHSDKLLNVFKINNLLTYLTCVYYAPCLSMDLHRELRHYLIRFIFVCFRVDILRIPFPSTHMRTSENT